MATKGPKTPAEPAATKPLAPAAKPVAPKARAAATAVEKSVPEKPVETIVPAPAPEPVPTVAAATQEVAQHVEKTIETVAEPVKAAAAEIAPTIEETVAPAVTTSTAKEKTIMASTIENSTVQAQAFFSDINERAKAAVEKSTKLVEEANEFAKGNIEAVVESSRIAAKGLESLGQEAAEYSRKSFESATATLKSLAAVKSPTDFFKLQSDYLRGAFDAYVAETSKHTEAFIKLAGDAAQPISNRFAVAVEKVKTVA